MQIIKHLSLNNKWTYTTCKNNTSNINRLSYFIPKESEDKSLIMELIYITNRDILTKN